MSPWPPAVSVAFDWSGLSAKRRREENCRAKPCFRERDRQTGGCGLISTRRLASHSAREQQPDAGIVPERNGNRNQDGGPGTIPATRRPSQTTRAAIAVYGW